MVPLPPASFPLSKSDGQQTFGSTHVASQRSLDETGRVNADSVSPSSEQPFSLHSGSGNAGCHGEALAGRAAAGLSLLLFEEGTIVMLS